MTATLLCHIGIHRYDFVWRDRDYHEECVRCGKPYRPPGPGVGLKAGGEFFRSGMASDRETSESDSDGAI